MKKPVKVLSLIMCLLAAGTSFSAQETQDIPKWGSYKISLKDINEQKMPFDDPRPYISTFGPKQVLPSEFYDMLSYDVEEMKELWSDTVGFRAPDIVGKIAPDIKPGKYTYKDVQANPGFKELMWPTMYNRIAPGGEGTNHAGNIPEFEIVPTRQYYWASPIAKATKENMGKTKLGEDGYIIPDSLTPGFPFPRPSGEFAAQKIMYDIENRYLSWGTSCYYTARLYAVDSKLNIDFEGAWEAPSARLANRLLIPPYGWFDGRAQANRERRSYLLHFMAPRDVSGFTQSAVYYQDPNKSDQLMAYIPAMRRVRKMSATDTQDPLLGTDSIYDDNEGWLQKLSPTRYPYKYELLEEREFLVPAPTRDGSEYISQKEGFAFKGVKFERRPMYVIKLTQLDPNYVYSYRIIYVDKEHLNFIHWDSYDQKGRLYRTFDVNYGFHPKMGMFSWSGAQILFTDHIDTHSTFMQPYVLPAFFNRKEMNIRALLKKSK